MKTKISLFVFSLLAGQSIYAQKNFDPDRDTSPTSPDEINVCFLSPELCKPHDDFYFDKEMRKRGGEDQTNICLIFPELCKPGPDVELRNIMDSPNLPEWIPTPMPSLQ